MNDVPLTADLRIAAAACVANHGEPRVLAAWAVSRAALSRALAGFPVKRSTRSLIERGIDTAGAAIDEAITANREGSPPPAPSPANSPTNPEPERTRP